MTAFVYDLPEGWQEERVTMPNGEIAPRYGRLRQKEFQYLGNKAPFREDGALFDRKNLLRHIFPTNLIKATSVEVTVTGRVEVTPLMIVTGLPPGSIPGGVTYALPSGGD